MDVRFISNITKEYPDMIRVMIYKSPRPYIVPEYNAKRCPADIDEYKPRISSLQRTKTLVRDIVLCNDFELFCTFTFDPDKVDRFNYSACCGLISRWIHNQKTKNPDMKYLFIPEQHKSGAWHFHALISGYKGSLRDSKHKSSSGRQVYNMTSYRGGFSTAVKIDNKVAVSNYVVKYISKSFIKLFNKKRFFCSRNLKRPIKSVNSPIFDKTLPIFRRHLYDGGDYDLYAVENF